MVLLILCRGGSRAALARADHIKAAFVTCRSDLQVLAPHCDRVTSGASAARAPRRTSWEHAPTSRVYPGEPCCEDSLRLVDSGLWRVLWGPVIEETEGGGRGLPTRLPDGFSGCDAVAVPALSPAPTATVSVRLQPRARP